MTSLIFLMFLQLGFFFVVVVAAVAVVACISGKICFSHLPAGGKFWRPAGYQVDRSSDRVLVGLRKQFVNVAELSRKM